MIERIQLPVRLGTIVVLLAGAWRGWGADLKPQASDGFNRYIATTELRLQKQESSPQSFLTLDSLPAPQRAEAEKRLREGKILIQQQDGVPKLPGALVHHWLGTAFLPGANLQSVLALVQDYDHLTRYYSPEVVRSRLISRQGNDFHIFMRLRKHKVVTVVLDTEYNVKYVSLDRMRVSSHSRSSRVTEIADPGEKGERTLPDADNHGFMWRLNTYWRFVQLGDGVLIECEAISLTRDVPTGLGWLVEPFVRNIPRESLEFTLRATRDAVERP